MGASRQVGRSFRVGGVLWGSAIAIATGGRLAVSSLRCPVSESRPRPSRLRGLNLQTVRFRRRSPVPLSPARLRGSAECSAAGCAVPVPLFLDRISPGKERSADRAASPECFSLSSARQETITFDGGG